MDFYHQRRRFLRQAGQVAMAVPGLSMLGYEVLAGNDVLASSAGQENAAFNQDKKLGVALVGLGKYSEEQLAPALLETQRCKLTAIVTGTPEKAGKWKEKYKIPDKNVYNYQNFDKIKDNPDVDIVYVVLPNSMHAEYTIRAAKAGKHVICEKPMATSVKDCEAMIKACKDAGKMLSIGYRLHFEPHNLTIAKFGKEQVHGKIKKVLAIDSQEMEKGAWRLDRERAGGGPVMDLGVYCVQGSIYAMGQNPVSVMAKEGAKTDVERFGEVEQTMDFQLEFPGGAMANCHTSYAESGNLLRVEAEKGWYELEPAYGYDGIKGKTSLDKLEFAAVNQQALQMDDFADCVRNKKPTRVPGEMGLRDVKILMAIYEAARTGKKIPLNLA
ncbi:Gfo/Idh/MocA family protein [Dyadobacter sandarakinus]|uniref:Gfo/Idh/MocA family oxidoreductase n=1 Tax=Dyadobacter sandarakinus TaxID=2747268 RepID=A0ABX7I2J9_9BACT|nr:Gfo/Idh/MocA family oxidoreductase [Dyadobacter sandarakinus]QRR00311.1 Gfo/Idh/MocA family oxidoreductase [Dyadobacter sandarakinus]